MVQVFNLLKEGAFSAFEHEREVLGQLTKHAAEKGIDVLPKLVTVSTVCDHATAASIVTEPVVSPLPTGTCAILAV